MNAELAGQMIAAAFAQARADYERPICVAVCDRFGFLVAFPGVDDAPVRNIQISQGKVYCESAFKKYPT